MFRGSAITSAAAVSLIRRYPCRLRDGVFSGDRGIPSHSWAYKGAGASLGENCCGSNVRRGQRGGGDWACNASFIFYYSSSMPCGMHRQVSPQTPHYKNQTTKVHGVAGMSLPPSTQRPTHPHVSWACCCRRQRWSGEYFL